MYDEWTHPVVPSDVDTSFHKPFVLPVPVNEVPFSNEVIILLFVPAPLLKFKLTVEIFTVKLLVPDDTVGVTKDETEPEATFDNTLANRFHYDHINMFDKSDSICKLVREGTNIEDIYKEIDKCQLLCVSCHSVVTKVELMCGFTRIKRQMTKEFNETEDEEKRNKLISEYSELYNKFMSEAYIYIRCSI